jgi:predicted RNase H-like nuclease (RuvC/YqgF family)
MKYIVVAGNPVDGLSFHGLFGTHDLASRWAEVNLTEDCWIGQVQAVDPQDWEVELVAGVDYDETEIDLMKDTIREGAKNIRSLKKKLDDANAEIKRLKDLVQNAQEQTEQIFFMKDAVREVMRDQIKDQHAEIADLKRELNHRDSAVDHLASGMREIRKVIDAHIER